MITSETIKDIEESGRRVDVYDLFDDDVEYPDKDMLVNGVPIGMNYSYISTTYLNGFINYVEIIGATMIQRYLPNKPEYVIDDTIPCWENACIHVDNLKNDFHTNISCSDDFDDVLILAKSSDSYWFFWDDRDGSDCCIGRLALDTFDSDETALKYLEISSRTVEDVYCNYYPVPKECFKGWITL